MLWVNLPVVNAIYLKSKRFVMGLKINVTAESKLNNRPV